MGVKLGEDASKLEKQICLLKDDLESQEVIISHIDYGCTLQKTCENKDFVTPHVVAGFLKNRAAAEVEIEELESDFQALEMKWNEHGKKFNKTNLSAKIEELLLLIRDRKVQKGNSETILNGMQEEITRLEQEVDTLKQAKEAFRSTTLEKEQLRSELDKEIEKESIASTTPLDESKKNTRLQQIEDAKQEISTLQEKWEDLKSKAKEVDAELDQNDATVRKIRADITASECSVKELQSESESLADEVKEKRALFNQSEQTYLSVSKENESFRKDLEQESNRQNNLKQSLDGFGDTSNTMCNTVDKMRRGCRDLKFEIAKIQSQVDGNFTVGSHLSKTENKVKEMEDNVVNLREESDRTAEQVGEKTEELESIGTETQSLRNKLPAARTKACKLEVELRFSQKTRTETQEKSNNNNSPTSNESPDLTAALSDPVAKESADKINKNIAQLKKDIDGLAKIKAELQRKLDLRKNEISKIKDIFVQQNKKHVEVQVLSTNYTIAKADHEKALHKLREELDIADEKFRADLNMVEKHERGGANAKAPNVSGVLVESDSKEEQPGSGAKSSETYEPAYESILDFSFESSSIHKSKKVSKKTQGDLGTMGKQPKAQKSLKRLRKKEKPASSKASSSHQPHAPKKNRREEVVKKRSSLPHLKLRQWEDDASDILVPSSQRASQT